MKLTSTANALPSPLEKIGYDGIIERIYTQDHPDVLRWTAKFQKLVEKRAAFPRFWQDLPADKATAISVAVQWHRFSELVPQFLCLAASKVSTNQKRHYVIQTAFEELGMRDAGQIHCDTFKSAASLTGITAEEFIRWQKSYPLQQALDNLEAQMMDANDDDTIFGLLLGLELPAEENIDTVFKGLCHQESLEQVLHQTFFFKIHLAVEIEHIRLTVSNFLRFCSTKEQKERFLEGVNSALDFWDRFWSSVKYQAEEIRGSHV